MYSTTEVRWFFQGPIPARVWSVYLTVGQQPISQPPRTDHYLLLTGHDDLGIKLRQGAVEIKIKTQSHGIHHFHPQVSGSVSSWVKWRFELTATDSIILDEIKPSSHWIAIRKTRWLHRYALKTLYEFPVISEDSRVDQGCEWELSQVQIEGHHNPWWSMAFEAFGSRGNSRELLITVAEMVLTNFHEIKCPPQASYSYPVWLSLIQSGQ